MKFESHEILFLKLYIFLIFGRNEKGKIGVHCDLVIILVINTLNKFENFMANFYSDQLAVYENFVTKLLGSIVVF